MGLIGLTLFGVLVGAAGSELLRVKNPELVEKIQDAARRFVDSMGLAKSADDEETKEQ